MPSIKFIPYVCIFMLFHVAASQPTVDPTYQFDFTKPKPESSDQCTSVQSMGSIRQTLESLIVTCSLEQDVAANCCELRKLLVPSGLYTMRGKQVTCDMDTDGGGWMVIQRRNSSDSSKGGGFMRNWKEYETGFGHPESNFWFGLTDLHELTNTRWSNELYIDLYSANGSRYYVHYSSFRVGGAETNYNLQLSGFNGTASDLLRKHNNWAFSTIDHDNDQALHSCAEISNGGWWFTANCGPVWPHVKDGLIVWGGTLYTAIEMKVRPHIAECINL